MVFHWSLSDSKSPQVSRTLLSILADLNVVVWMVSAHSPISKSSCPLTKLLRIVSSAPLTTGNYITFMFHCFLVFWQGLLTFIFFFFFFFFFFVFFDFYSMVCRDGQVHYSVGSLSFFLFCFVLFCFLSFGLVLWPGLGDLLVFQNHSEFCVSHSSVPIPIYAYTIW